MNMTRLLLKGFFFLALSSTTAMALTGQQDESIYTVSCPPEDVSLAMAGLDHSNVLIEAWAKAYQTEYCPGFDIAFQDITYGEATASVCASSLLFNPVDLAGIDGPFFPSQVDEDDGLNWRFVCKRSKLGRETILVSHCCVRVWGP
jgi:hypothetical protein